MNIENFLQLQIFWQELIPHVCTNTSDHPVYHTYIWYVSIKGYPL